MESHHVYWENSLFQWPCSKSLCNSHYQRIYPFISQYYPLLNTINPLLWSIIYNSYIFVNSKPIHRSIRSTDEVGVPLQRRVLRRPGINGTAVAESLLAQSGPRALAWRQDPVFTLQFFGWPAENLGKHGGLTRKQVILDDGWSESVEEQCTQVKLQALCNSY